MDPKTCDSCGLEVIEKKPPCPSQCRCANCSSYKKKFIPDLSEKTFVWVMGAPCSNKRRLAYSLAKKFNFHFISVGDIIKAEIKELCAKEDPRAKCMLCATERYELIPNDMIIGLLKKEIESKARDTKGYVIKGFPREERQGFLFDKVIGPVTVIYLVDLPHDVLLARNEAWLNSCRREPKKFKHLVINSDAAKVKLREFYTIRKQIKDQYPHKLHTLDGNQEEGKVFREMTKLTDQLLEKIGAKRREERQKIAEDSSRPCFKDLTGEFGAPANWPT